MTTNYTELVAGTEALVSTLGIFAGGKGVIPALTPLMQDATNGALVVWDGEHAGQSMCRASWLIQQARRRHRSTKRVYSM
jgi:hypothetical protein